MPWLAKQNETQRERERENYLSHGICLLVQASDSRAKSYGETKYLCVDQVLDSTFDLVSFFFLLDLQLNPPTHSPGAFQMPSTLDPPQIARAACSPHRHRAGAPPVGAARVPPTPGVTSAALAETRPCRTVSKPWGRAPLASIILVPLV